LVRAARVISSLTIREGTRYPHHIDLVVALPFLLDTVLWKPVERWTAAP